MDWSRGYSAKYYASLLNPTTLVGGSPQNDLEIISGSIKRTPTDLRESATISCKDTLTDADRFIRIWLETTQGDDSSRIPLFTGITSYPKRSIEGEFVSNDIECYSVLKIAQDILLPRGWYVPLGINGGSMIKKLLSVCGVPITIAPNSPSITQSIIAEDGENNLSMVEKILYQMGWRLMLNGLGEIRVVPNSSDVLITFGAINNDILETSISFDYDYFNCPNVYRAVMDDAYAIARDDNPNSRFSTISRGREIWYEETSCTPNENETLPAYAKRQLEELQRTAIQISYSRRFWPEVYPTDYIGLYYPDQGLVGKYIVTSQDITLGYNATTSEEVIQYE